MPTYIIYDKSTGDILHVHKEYYMGSEQTIEVDEKRLMKELGDTLPQNLEIDVLSVDESPQPVRGYKYFVDLRTSKLMLIKKPSLKKGK